MASLLPFGGRSRRRLLPGGPRLSRPLARRALYPRRPRRVALWGGSGGVQFTLRPSSSVCGTQMLCAYADLAKTDVATTPGIPGYATIGLCQDAVCGARSCESIRNCRRVGGRAALVAAAGPARAVPAPPSARGAVGWLGRVAIPCDRSELGGARSCAIVRPVHVTSKLFRIIISETTVTAGCEISLRKTRMVEMGGESGGYPSAPRAEGGAGTSRAGPFGVRRLGVA